jgi:hypothetical protein
LDELITKLENINEWAFGHSESKTQKTISKISLVLVPRLEIKS